LTTDAEKPGKNITSIKYEFNNVKCHTGAGLFATHALYPIAVDATLILCLQKERQSIH